MHGWQNRLLFAGMEKLLFKALSACMLAALPGCEIIDVTGEEEARIDSLFTVIVPARESIINNADVFLYSDKEVRRLEGHVHLGRGEDSAVFKTPSGDKLAVVIANSPRTFNDQALISYDSMEVLPFYYCDEDRDFPMMSGSTSCRAGDTLSVSMYSFMCSVNLRSVEHSFSNYGRLEDPIMYMENVSASAEALRRDSFLPAETTNDTTGMRGLMWERLPCDVGMYPQYPKITLNCYPNESSVNRSRLVVVGCVDGKVCKFSTELPSLSAGSVVSADLTIGSTPDKYSFSVY